MTEDRNAGDSETTKENPLESWKEIAAYLKRDVTTVRRWEKTQGLPVRRHLHHSRSSVFVHPSELDAWWANRSPGHDLEAPAAPRFRPLRLAALAAALMLSAATSGDGVVRQVVSAQSRSISARQVWTGQAVDTTGARVPGTPFLSFVDWETGDLAIRDLVSGEQRRLTNKGSWSDSGEFAITSAPSPDGRRIAYSWSTKSGGAELRVVPLDGGAPRVLYSDAEVSYVQAADWSPDGRRILTLLTRKDNTQQIALISDDGSAQVLKTLDWRFPLKLAFSPDGRFIAFDFPPAEKSPQRDIFIMSANGEAEIPLVRHGASDFLPTWSPDGTRVVFVSDRAGSIGLWAIDVRDGRPHGAPELLKPDAGRISAMSFGTDGGLYYGLEAVMTDVYVASVDPAAGIVLETPAPISQRFVGANSGADWSPDGNSLLYVSERGPGGRNVYAPTFVIQSLKTGEEREFVPPLTRPNRPRWSPDGRRLLVHGLDRNGGRGIFGVDPRTGATELLVPLIPAGYRPLPAWSADGSAVFYTYPKDGTLLLRMRNLQTRQERVLYPTNAHSLAPSPDGKALAFTDAVTHDGVTENILLVLPLDGGEPRELARVRQPEMIALDSVVWTRDGRHLMFASGAGRQHALWRVSATGGDAQKMNVTMAGMNVGLRLHPDGRRIAFMSGERKSEIWVLENLLPNRAAR